MHDADGLTELDRSLAHDLIEELRERYAAARLRRTHGKTANVSMSKATAPTSNATAAKRSAPLSHQQHHLPNHEATETTHDATATKP